MKMQIMDTFTFFIIFMIILFLYVHIIAQYKKSEDLEIYEMDYTQGLQEICDLKQPLLFRFTAENPITFENLSYKNDVRVYSTAAAGGDPASYVLLPFTQFQNLVATTARPHYYTENNRDFIDEVGLYNTFRELDPFLKPYYTAQTIYDIWAGGPLVTTPLRYHINYRQYLYVTSGKIHVKMTPYKSRKYLYPIDDYENFDFRSPVNPFAVQAEYMHDMDKIKFLEFDVHAGFILYLPPYWWYSIQYAADRKDTVVMSVIYNSTMNILANAPSIARYYMQLHNTKNIILKTIGSQSLDKEGEQNEQRERGEQREKEETSEKSHIELFSTVPSAPLPSDEKDDIMESIRMIQK